MAILLEKNFPIISNLLFISQLYKIRFDYVFCQIVFARLARNGTRTISRGQGAH